MKALCGEYHGKHNLARHPKAKFYMPGGSLHSSMHRFNEKLLACIDPEGDFFAVPLKGDELGFATNREYVTVWQVGIREGTAELRYVLYDYQTMEPLHDLSKEQMIEICGYYAHSMPREDFDKLTARVEEGWKRWRDDLAEAEISKNLEECDERDDFLKRNPVSRTVVSATTNAEPGPEPEPEKPKRKRRSRARKKVEAEPEGEALFSNQTGTEG